MPHEETDLSAPKNLEDCYVEELAGNWSVNDQLLKIVGQRENEASEPKLRERLTKTDEALGQRGHAAKLASAMAEIYGANETMTCLVERSVNLQAKGRI